MALPLVIVGIMGVALAVEAAYAALQAAADYRKTFSNKSPTSPTQPCPSAVPDTYGKNIRIEGDEEFRRKTIAALDDIKKTASGQKLLDSIEASGKPVTIEKTSGGNQVTGFSSAARIGKDGKPGAGSGSTVHFNPDNSTIGTQKWETRPPAIGLAHELIHADHAAHGTIDMKKVANDSKPDPSDPKKTATWYAEEVRTTGVSPYDKEPYSENAIRREWGPKQPDREWY